jgi:hypothetical protein
VSLDVTSLFSVTARVSVDNVPREMFSVDPDQALLAAEKVEAGLIEFVLRDAGALDLAIAQFAKQQGLSLRAARTVLIDTLNQSAAPLAKGNLDIRPVVEAIAQFIEAPRSTLTLRVIPKGRVIIQQAIETAIDDPTAALSQFRIEATTRR